MRTKHWLDVDCFRVLLGLIAFFVGGLITKQANAAGPKPIDFGVGLLGVAGANFLDKPSEKTYKLETGQMFVSESYPGFAGFSGGGGLMLEGRVFGVIGLEIDVFRTSDRGKGKITVNNSFDYHVTIGQTSWHLPILLKAVLPTGLVRPVFLFGPELVFPGQAEASADESWAPPLGAEANSYTLLTGAIGLEMKLPIPGVDVRIPFAARGSYNPGVGKTLNDRVRYNLAGNAITSITYFSNWKYQTVGTLGVAAYF